MKKYIFIVIAVIIMVMVINENKNDYYIIPEESIRLRIIPNSNSIEDQYIKTKVKENIEKELKNTLNEYSTLEESRKNIQKNIPIYEKLVQKTFEEENYYQNFNIKYGYHHFPQKEYKGVIYEEGDYESLLISIGEAKGDNWWCVLFPPLCTLEVEESTEIEYRFFIKDFITKYLSK